jgi:hypothetical protein
LRAQKISERILRIAREDFRKLLESIFLVALGLVGGRQEITRLGV